MMKQIKNYTQKNNHSKINVELLNNVHNNIPINFSKKLPFFLKNKKN